MTDIIEDMIGDAPAQVPSEGQCITIEEEEKEAEKAAKEAKEKLIQKENIAP